MLVDEIQNTLSTIVLEQVNEFMGYFRYSCHLYGFRSNSGLRNTLGIEKAYLFELRKSPLAYEVATCEVTLT